MPWGLSKQIASKSNRLATESLVEKKPGLSAQAFFLGNLVSISFFFFHFFFLNSSIFLFRFFFLFQVASALSPTQYLFFYNATFNQALPLLLLLMVDQPPT